MKELLNLMSHGIKETETFLFNYPIYQRVECLLEDGNSLTWEVADHRIHYTIGNQKRRLIEWDVENRVAGYKKLPDLVVWCFEAQKRFKLEEIKMIDGELKKLFKESK